MQNTLNTFERTDLAPPQNRIVYGGGGLRGHEGKARGDLKDVILNFFVNIFVLIYWYKVCI